jgi:hypothetical protein
MFFFNLVKGQVLRCEKPIHRGRGRERCKIIKNAKTKKDLKEERNCGMARYIMMYKTLCIYYLHDTVEIINISDTRTQYAIAALTISHPDMRVKHCA